MEQGWNDKTIEHFRKKEYVKGIECIYTFYKSLCQNKKKDVNIMTPEHIQEISQLIKEAYNYIQMDQNFTNDCKEFYLGILSMHYPNATNDRNKYTEHFNYILDKSDDINLLEEVDLIYGWHEYDYEKAIPYLNKAIDINDKCGRLYYSRYLAYFFISYDFNEVNNENKCLENLEKAYKDLICAKELNNQNYEEAFKDIALIADGRLNDFFNDVKNSSCN